MRFVQFYGALAAISGVSAQQIYLGFNSGATNDKNEAKSEADFEKDVRLYSNIQRFTTDTPIEAFAAAVKTNTSLLLGIWCSGTDSIENELSASNRTIDQYGSSFTDLVMGISVGSEDLYRVSETRDVLRDTPLSDIPVGHVDAWSAWVNSSNEVLIEAVDFVGVDIYPYYEDNLGNDISNASTIFNDLLNRTETAAGNKPVWVTETGWPTTGPKWGNAEPSVENAKTFWDEVGCRLFGRTNTWYYILRDSNPDNTMKFALDPELDSKPAYNLTCPAGAGAPAAVNTQLSNGAASAIPGPSAMIFGLLAALTLAV
ncbi:glycoside hydrolase [Bimuria novae-zelandiae CBS 107.79]|uniref:Glycoside hydrolase n=1 Tax=Bimuria novae-zelandiae CBS 107.79 TaxID=1447943 RepID=A0A6A5ULF3_9PLEO|nr:glycoside hydrolase [Bimuria novae-zelandiae CBS 107.79]